MAAVFFNSYTAYSQVSTASHDVGFAIPAVAKLDIEPVSPTVTLSFTSPTEAGLPLTTGSSATNNTKWLNYSSAIAPSATTRRVTAQIMGGTLPSGIQLTLLASAFSGSGAGTTGASAGTITLNNTAKNIITGIGGAYTGNGMNNGHRLTYNLLVSNYAQLNFNQTVTVQVTFTLTD